MLDYEYLIGDETMSEGGRLLSEADMQQQNFTNMTLADFDAPEEEHAQDANVGTIVNLTLIACFLLAYCVKQYRIYYLPESAGAMILGIIIGGIARLVASEHLVLFEFSPEIFFFVLLPPIIFEAGYSLKQKDFFENIGAITLYAMIGTVISCFVVGLLTFYAAKLGYIDDIDKENPMEALLFGALISAVDPVATLSIMGNNDLQCNPLLYSLVFGESVLNDAIAIVLFKTFHKYYNPEGPNLSEADIPAALLSFIVVSLLSILVGVALGLLASFMYKHTSLVEHPKLETSLLFSFCYLCYSTAEALELSGIMALFFHGIILSHYNSYNLSSTAQVASEHIFSTLANITETIVFLYMGMGVFTGRFAHWNVTFSLMSLALCVLGRFLNIFPLSYIANACRRKGHNKISCKMQVVLWFAGLRGAIAFALSENMPGPNKDTYATATLSICIFTTIVCGGLTEPILTVAGMKTQPEEAIVFDNDDDVEKEEVGAVLNGDSDGTSPLTRQVSNQVYDSAKHLFSAINRQYLRIWFGGPHQIESARRGTYEEGDSRLRGEYELTRKRETEDEDDIVVR